MSVSVQLRDDAGTLPQREGLALPLVAFALVLWALSIRGPTELSPVAWVLLPLWVAAGTVSAWGAQGRRRGVAIALPPLGCLVIALSFADPSVVFASAGWWLLLSSQGLLVLSLQRSAGSVRWRAAAGLPWRPLLWWVMPGVAVLLTRGTPINTESAHIVTLALAWYAALWTLVVWPLTFSRLVHRPPSMQRSRWLRGWVEGCALLAWSMGAPYILNGQWGLALTLQATGLLLVHAANRSPRV